MLPTRIFRNRWHALLFAGMTCMLAMEFASDVPASGPIRADSTVTAARSAPAPTADPAPPQVDAGPSLFAGLLGPSDSGGGRTHMLSFDADGDGIPETTVREVR